MAKTGINTTILCIIATLLLLLHLSHVRARPGPAFHDVTPMEAHRGDNEVQQKANADRERCVGLGEEECMMRRALEAHLDYIYTQKQKRP